MAVLGCPLNLFSNSYIKGHSEWLKGCVSARFIWCRYFREARTYANVNLCIKCHLCI